MPSSDLHTEICAIPVIDVHSHLPWHRIGATSLEDVFLYHMMRYLYRAVDVDEFMLFAKTPDPGLLTIAVEKFGLLRSTSFGKMLHSIVRDVYGFEETISVDSLPRLRGAFERFSSDPAVAFNFLKTTGIVRVLSSWLRDVPPRDPSLPDHGIRFTIESSPSGGTEDSVTIKQRIETLMKRGKTHITTFADVQQMIDVYFNAFDWTGKSALVAWIGARADFTPVEPGVIDAIIADALAGVPDTPRAVTIFQAAVVRCMCSVVNQTAGTFQLVYGTQAITRGNGHFVQRSVPEFAGTLGFLFGEFPKIHFNILNGCEADEPLLCSLCNAYANVSLSGLWWHAFHPSALRAAWHRRLEMVPTSRLCGFFSDGWCIEWIYARLNVVREVLAQVLGEKIDAGYFTRAEAIDVARQILYETPRRLFLRE